MAELRVNVPTGFVLGATDGTVTVHVGVVVEPPLCYGIRRAVHAEKCRPHVVRHIKAPDVVRPRGRAIILRMEILVVR